MAGFFEMAPYYLVTESAFETCFRQELRKLLRCILRPFTWSTLGPMTLFLVTKVSGLAIRSHQ